jgi:hypothetical protein
MDEKKLIIAQKELKAKLQEIAVQGTSGNSFELAKLANIPYDAEMPIPEVIKEVAQTASVAKGEDYEYFVEDVETKVVFTISNGSVNQTAVTPGSETDLTFNSYSSDEYYVYVEKLLEAKYDPIAIKSKNAMESLDRKEVKDVLDLLIASAVAKSNTFANDSGDSVIDFEKVVDMVRSVAKYGNKLVFITGADVTTDVILMDYSEDKNREVSLAKAGIAKWVKLESLTYTHSGSQTVFASDKALLVATSDSEGNRPIHFVRRKVRSLEGAGEKERIIVSAGPRIQVGANPKWAYAITAMEQYGAVVTNPLCVAVYKKAESYS